MELMNGREKSGGRRRRGGGTGGRDEDIKEEMKTEGEGDVENCTCICAVC